MRSTLQHFTIALVAAASVAFAAHGHETDQFSLPAGREFADLGRHLNNWFYQAIERGVESTNRRIASALKSNRGSRAVTVAQSPEELVSAVNAEFPDAYSLIEGMETLLKSDSMAQRYPGQVVGFEKQFGNIYQHVHFPLDPRQFFRIWHASTFKAYGVYMGTDKIGHFVDMGMHYYRAYRDALRDGLTEDQAMQKAIAVGTHGPIFSERGMVGYLSAGAYSNSDLAANYVGFLFYKNLYLPVVLEGKARPAMVVRDGDYWRIQPHVGVDTDYFEVFVSDHLNEVMNPSHFEASMRDELRKAIRKRTPIVLARYSDEHGNRRCREFFESAVNELRTYYGQEYGYRGPHDEMVMVANTCFDRPPRDADLKWRSLSGQTALHLAASEGDVESAKRLIALGADVNAQVRSDESYSSEWGNTPLHEAAAQGRIDVVKLLLENYANVNISNDRGQTPLHRAVPHPEIVEILVETLAQIDARTNRGETALHWAAMGNHARTAELLLLKGADPNARDHSGRSPLHFASRSDSLETASLLIEKRAHMNALDEFDVTPLHDAATFSPQVVELLLHAGAALNPKDQFGRTPLHEAARQGTTQAAELLLDRGVPVDIADAHRCTPLHLAARNGRKQVAATLIARGASINSTNSIGASPLHEASFAGQKAIVQWLLDQNADPTLRNARGFTALDIADSKQFKEISTLLRNGAHVSAGVR